MTLHARVELDRVHLRERRAAWRSVFPAALGLLLLLFPAAATPAGDGGEIAFAVELGQPQVYSMRADGSDCRVLTLESFPSENPTASPNGKLVAYSSNRSGQAEIYVQPHGGGAPRNLTRNPAADTEPSWSPNGRWIAFVSDRGGKPSLYRMRTDGSDLRRLTRSPSVDELPMWSPNSRRIAFSRGRDKNHYDVYVIGSGGGAAVRLTRNRFDNWGPRFSPDGRRIAYTEGWPLGNEYPSAIAVIRSDGSHRRLLTKPGGDSGIRRNSYPTWSPDGKRIAYWQTRGDPGIWIVNAAGSRPRLLGGMDAFSAVNGLLWTRNGRFLFSSEVMSDLQPIVALSRGKERRRVTSGEEEDLQPRWSPDGKRIAFVRFLGEGHADDLYVADANGRNARSLTRGPADDQEPAWSPDGSQIVFAGDRDSERTLVDLYVISVSGGDVRPLVSDPWNDAEPDWSPDGSQIAFARFPPADENSDDEEILPGDIYTVGANGSGAGRLTSDPADDEEPRFSPDGRTIAFTSTRDGHFQLYLMNADGSGQHRLLASSADDREPSWSPDGRSLVFDRYTNAGSEIWIVNSDGSDARKFTTTCPVDDSYSCIPGYPAAAPTWRAG